MRDVMGIALLALSLLSTARAEVLAVCGSSKGWAYYVPGGISPVEQSEWTEDKISSGNFQLIRSGQDYDVIFTDASGGTLSAKGDGGEIVGFSTDDGDVVVTIF